MFKQVLQLFRSVEGLIHILYPDKNGGLNVIWQNPLDEMKYLAEARLSGH